MDKFICPSCEQAPMEIFHEVAQVPSNSCILLDSTAEAVAYPRGDVALGFCPACGFISNTRFDAKLTEYSGRYEETQGFSGTFRSFHEKLARRLIDKYDLHDKTVLEIGCGKGEFITMLSELGQNTGVGFDPSYREERNVSEAAGRVTFIKDFYSEKYAEYQADFLACKMTLEHIHRAGDFIGTVRRSVGDRADTVLFFQIPEATRILRDCAFEDIYYEHCSYFSPGSLARLFRRHGFEVLNVEIEYGDQYLTIEARPGGGADFQPLPGEDDLDELRALVASFPQRCAEKLSHWNRTIEELSAAGRKVVLWGSGSKGVSFLTTLDVSDRIEYVVDINPYRQGFHMSGTGQRIVAPEFLAEYRPDAVVVMNAIYVDEIGRDLAKMDLHPQMLAL